MVVNGNISGNVYERFIKYAISVSNTFLFVTQGTPKIVDNTKFLENIRINEPKLHTPLVIKRHKNMEKQSVIDVQTYELFYSTFVPQFEPYLLKRRIAGGEGWQETLGWPATEKIISKSCYTVDFYNATDEVETLLLEPEKYLNWQYPKYPEDLSFFRDNYCWSVVTSHEKLIQIFPKDYEEYQILKDMGINFVEEYVPTKKEWMFYEEY